MTSGAIDLGGTKIEARLFDDTGTTIETQRIPTPTADFTSFIDGLSHQIDWLISRAGDAELPVGICLPGWIDPATQTGFAANVPITGRDVGAALRARFGRPIPLMNDCMALAYSEAHGGAGDGAQCVLGVIIGTGLGAGLTIAGELPPRMNGIAVEIGHVGLPARALLPHDLPLIPCGCGKIGCMERYVSGQGLSDLSRRLLGQSVTNEDLVARAAAEPDCARVLDIWAGLLAECLLTLQLIADPDCIVLGGGLSKISQVCERLSAAFEERRLGPIRVPPIRLARFGDSSGARGAALFAHAQAPC